jgi:hypothetical protein
VRGWGASLHAADMPPRLGVVNLIPPQVDQSARRPWRKGDRDGGGKAGRTGRTLDGRPKRLARRGGTSADGYVSPPRRLPWTSAPFEETDCARWRATGKPVWRLRPRSARPTRRGLRRCYFDRAALLIRRRQRWFRCPVPAREQAAPAGTPCSPPCRLRLRRPERSSRIG